MTKPRRPRSTALAFWVTLFIAVHCLGAPPTDGLIHWWPDPAEGTDQVTGRKGIRRGFGPTEKNPEVRFGYAAGWVELGPGITNRTFTISGWVRVAMPQLSPHSHTILAHGSGLGDGWSLRCGNGFTNSQIVLDGGALRTRTRETSSAGNRAQAFAIRSTPREIELWLNGVLVSTNPRDWPQSAEPAVLFAGNSALGNSPWDGDLRDLRIYDRLLTEEELGFLASAEPTLPVQPAISSTTLPAQSVVLENGSLADYSLRQFTTDNGLPSSDIQCLLQLGNGRLWIGTEEGLTQFDGRQFATTDATAPEFRIPGSDVGAIAQDGADTRWLGVFHGLVRQKGDQWQTFTNIGPAQFIRRVVAAPDGTVWLAGHRDTEPRGRCRLRHFDPIRNRLLADTYVPGRVLNLALADDGVWIGTDEPPALWRYLETTGSIELILHLAATVPQASSYHQLPFVRRANSIVGRELQVHVWQESDGTFQWVQALVGRKQLSWTWTRSAPADWHMVETSTDDSLSEWVPAPTGLLRHRRNHWERLKFSGVESNAEVLAMASNAEGGVWAATKGDGLWLVQPRSVQMLRTEQGWGNHPAQTLQKLSDGRLMIAGQDNLAARTRLARIAPRADAPPETSPQTYGGGLVAEALDGSLLRVSMRSGTEGFTRERGEDSWSYAFRWGDSLLPLLEVSQLHVARDGSVWIVAENGLVHIPDLPIPDASHRAVILEPSAYSHHLNGLPGHVTLHGLAEAPDSAIWVGSTGAGLFRISEGRVENFPESEMLTDNPTVPLGFSMDGTLWLGSEAGLGIWRNGQYRWVRPADGLPESVVSDVEEAEGNVWFVGRRGVHAIPWHELESFFAGTRSQVSAISLGRADGLASTQTQLKSQPVMAKTDDGQIWIATAHGVAYFHPSDVLARLRPPPVAVDRLTVHGQAIPLRSGPIPVPPGGGRAVEIAFSSLSFVAPERVTFQYRLTGPGGPMDVDAKETAQGYAVFTHLRPGRHVFTVKARSGNGVTSYPAASLEFDIEPHFYQTPTFYLLLGLGSILSVAGLVFARVRVAERRAAREQERRLVAERTRIAQDMHDDLGSGLARLAWKNGAMDTSNTEDFRKQIQQMARDLLRSLDEAVWAINPTKDHLEGMVNYLGSWLQDYFTDSPLTLDLDLPSSVPDQPVPAQWRHHVLMIVREICSNAVKHSQATQMSAVVCLAVEPAALSIQLRDNGVGFPRDPDAAPSPEGSGQSTGKLGGNGIQNLRDRAAALRARLQIVSHPGSGTEVTLTVPLPPEA